MVEASLPISELALKLLRKSVPPFTISNTPLVELIFKFTFLVTGSVVRLAVPLKSRKPAYRLPAPIMYLRLAPALMAL